MPPTRAAAPHGLLRSVSIFKAPGDFFGEMALLDDAPRSASVMAMAPSALLVLRRADFRAHVRSFEAAGVDQIILLQQAGRNRHEHICSSLELLAAEVLPDFAPQVAEREKRKAEELAPYIARALARKKVMPPLADADIPVVRAAVAKPVVNQGVG